MVLSGVAVLKESPGSKGYLYLDPWRIVAEVALIRNPRQYGRLPSSSNSKSLRLLAEPVGLSSSTPRQILSTDSKHSPRFHRLNTRNSRRKRNGRVRASVGRGALSLCYCLTYKRGAD